MWADFSQTGKLINRKQQIGRAKNIEWIVYVDGGNREFYFYTSGESFSAVGYSRDRNVRLDHTGVVDQFRRPVKDDANFICDYFSRDLREENF